MLSDVTLGQFFPGRSVLHAMDPRVKVLLTVLFIVVVFLPQNWAGLGLILLFLVLSIGLSRLPVTLILRSLKPILPIVLFTSLINLLYVQGEVLWEWWIFHVSVEGIVTAVFVAVRIVALIAGSSLLTYTTSPTALTNAIERVLKPLRYLRVNVQEMAMMMTIALRFIPTLIEETDKIMSAQKARGADLESGGLLQRIKALIPILIPLFVSSFRRAYELATAMECRCYTGVGATRMKQLHITVRDVLAVLLMALLMAGVIVCNLRWPAVV